MTDRTDVYGVQLDKDTHVQITSAATETTDDGIEVTVKAERLPGGVTYARATPRAADLPVDVRAALTAWLRLALPEAGAFPLPGQTAIRRVEGGLDTVVEVVTTDDHVGMAVVRPRGSQVTREVPFHELRRFA